MDHLNALARQDGNDQPASGHQPFVSRLIKAILPILILLLAVLILLAPVWGEGYPWGSDTWGHLHRAAYMGRAIRDYGLVEGFNQSAWMREWYLGDPMMVYYPPLTTVVLGVLTAAVDDVFLAYRLFVTALFLSLALSTYWIGLQWQRHPLAAVLGGLLAITAPYTLHTIFAEGNLGRGIALVLFPWVIWYSDKVLREKGGAAAVVALSILWAVLITAHVMQAAIFVVAMAAYVLLRIVSNIFIPFRRAVLAMLPIGIGLGLSAIYLLPAYGHGELRSIPYLPAEKIDQFVTPLSALLPYHSSIEAISVGIALFILALLIALHTPKGHHRALFLVGVLSLFLSFGRSIGLYQLLPLNQSMLPERFLNASAILFPLLVATMPMNVWRRRWLLAAVGIVLVIDGLPAARMIFMRPAPPDEQAIAEVLATQPLTGRAVPLVFPDTTSSLIYMISEIGQRDNVSGWALENTPHQNIIRRLTSAVNRSPSYLNRILSLWNVDYVVGRFPDPVQAARLNDELKFLPIAQSNGLDLWARDSGSSFLQRLPANRMLMIGETPTDWLFAFPFASEGVDSHLNRYDPAYLAHFSVIGLNRISHDSDVEAMLGDWVREGNTLIVDMSGMEQMYQADFRLFGVRVTPRVIRGEYPISWTPFLNALPSSLTFATDEGPWIGATYTGLDTVFGTLQDGDQAYEVLGYRSIGQGRVWFVGLNLFYLFGQMNDQHSATALADFIVASTPVDRALSLPSFDAALITRNPSRIRFRYTSTEAVKVILSMTYFPRWQAFVDDTPIPLLNHENLAMLNLPAGSHNVTLTYDATNSDLMLLGGFFSTLTLLSLVFIGLLLRVYPVTSIQDRITLFEGQDFSGTV